MAGFFDTSGLGPQSDSTNNAAADFGRLNAENPGQFKNGIFERLFGRKPSKEEQHAQSVAAAAPQEAPPAPAMREMPRRPPPSPPPAISSGAGLVGRVLGSATQPPQAFNAQGQALVPGTPFTPDQFAQQLLASQHPITDQNQLPPYQGIPQFRGPEPPQRRIPTVMDGIRDRFQGAMQRQTPDMATAAFGVAPPGLPPMMTMPSIFPGGQPPAPPPPPGRGFFDRGPFPNPQAGAGGLPVPPRRPFFGPIMPQQHADGGPIALRRGGYPANLMMGLPQRFGAGGNNYVPHDGEGDGRSDHVPAVLSPGEFVQDAETVALLGNGSSEAGARGMEAIRQQIRKDKGKALAKGKFSPDAKSPAHYAKVGMRAASKGRA